MWRTPPSRRRSGGRLSHPHQDRNSHDNQHGEGRREGRNDLLTAAGIESDLLVSGRIYCRNWTESENHGRPFFPKGIISMVHEHANANSGARIAQTIRQYCSYGSASIGPERRINSVVRGVSDIDYRARIMIRQHDDDHGDVEDQPDRCDRNPSVMIDELVLTFRMLD